MTVGDSLRALLGTVTTFDQMLNVMANAFDEFEAPPESAPAEDAAASKKK